MLALSALERWMAKDWVGNRQLAKPVLNLVGHDDHLLTLRQLAVAMAMTPKIKKAVEFP